MAAGITTPPVLARLKALLPHKARATAIHLGLSGLIFGVLLYLILFRWYPQPWFAIDGGWQGVRIMIFVDMVLGPTLTFLVFNPNKTRLALGVDFSFIALVQISALVWGIYAVYTQRPLAIVHWDDRFYSVDRAVLKKQNLDASVLAHLGDKLPVLAFVEDPDNPDEKIELAMKAITEGISDYEHPRLYRPIGEHLNAIFAKQITLPRLLEKMPQAQPKLQQLASENGLGGPEELKYLRFSGRYEEATLIFTPDGKVVGSLGVELEPVDTTKPVKKAQSKGSRRG